MSQPAATGRAHEAPPERRARRDDPARLAALARTGLMDSVSEAAFDRAVRLATRLLGAPVGLLSLVDSERQFFKAQTGVTGLPAQQRGTPLSHSFCQHVVENDAALIVRDAREDDRVRENPAVSELGVVAYLGVPVHDADGHVLGSFCTIQDEPRDWTDADREALEDIAAGIETEIALRAELVRTAEAGERLRLALHAGRIGTYDFDPGTQEARWDDELYAIWGLPRDTPDIFAALAATIHPDDRAAWEADVAASLDPHGPGRHRIEMRIRHAPSGETRWVRADGNVAFADGAPVRMVGTVQDITDRKRAEEHGRLLTREMNHRVKNLFAVVAGLIGLTARTSETPRAMATALRARIQALASAHALIQPAITGEDISTTDVTLQALATVVLEAHIREAEYVTLQGPTATLAPSTASSLALVLHELATNAAKYGALSSPVGRLDVTWSIEGDGESRTLHIVWTESAGPAIAAPPTSKGFGSTLIEMTVKSQMRGALETDWRPEGVRHRISLPLGRGA